MFYNEQQSSLPGSPSYGAVSVSLNHAHIANAALALEAPSTLDFSKLNLTEIPTSSVYELAQLPNNDTGDSDGTVLRLALHKNLLSSLPASFNLLRRLRYLNLRSNAFSYFPDVLPEMESLEILDLSRNKIKSFPITPGCLLQLKVLHLGHNRITSLPNYFPSFRDLDLFRIEQNPIDWPPPNIMNFEPSNNPDGQMVLKRWINSVQAWIQDQLSRQDPTSVYHDFTNNQRHEDFDNHRGLTHDRMPSNESVGSHYSSASQSSAPASPRDRRLNKLALPDYLDGYSSSDRSALDHPGVLVPPHGRNGSLSYARRQNSNGTSLQSKKSLPELRTIQLHSSDRRTKGRPSNAEREPMPPFPPQHQHSMSKGFVSDNNQTIRGLPSSIANREESSEMTQPPPMDGERNSYFRRMSTLPASTISKAVPESLLVTVDAARGILFALSQLYSALRHYIVFAINDRLSSVLNKVLDPASQYLHRLITALDRFDSLCRRGTPPPAACRGVLESCRDNITVFSKVIGVLQLQLKVLAGSDDVRYTRTLLMMLYGSAAELSNSWNAMAPHVEAVQDLVRDRHNSGSSVEPALPLNLPKRSRAMHSISEDDNISERTITSGRVAVSSNGRAKTPRSAVRPHAGSFSARHVQMGKDMASGSSPVQPLVIQAPSSTSMAMRAVLRQGPAISSPRSNQSHGSSAMHSPSNSYSSHGHVHMSSREDLTQIANGASPHGVLSSDKDKFVDADTLKSMEESTDLALSVWKQVEDFFDTAGEGSMIGRDYLMRAREVTMSLRSNIRAVLDSSTDEIYGAALWDGANTFSKDVANVLTFVKKTCTERRLPLDASLRADLGKLSHTTQEFVTFLAVSSFAAGKPPASPAPNFGLSPVPHDDRGGMQNGSQTPNGLSPSPAAPLWRSRSAGVAGSPVPQTPPLNRGNGSAGGGGVYQSSMSAGSPHRTGPAHPSLANFRMPSSPAPGGRVRHGGGIVGYKDSD